MKKFLFFFCVLVQSFYSQSLSQSKQRFDHYLNLKGSLNSAVKFEADAIFIMNGAGKKELAIYANEIKLLADFLEHATFKNQEELFKKKGLKKFSKRERDSISIYIDDRKSFTKDASQLPLKGFRIALDPGHSAITLVEARIEQKYLYFVKDSLLNPNDSIKLFESFLTFNTAAILKKMLEQKGAKVMLTRDRADFTSFNCTYSQWFNNYKLNTLDSLFHYNLITEEKYRKLIKTNEYVTFWDFFRDYDLANRARKINKFNPHASVIIHYNVDEKNEPWKKMTDKNYTMAFIGGAFTEDNLNAMESKIHFLRLLLTNQLNESERLAAYTVSNFNKNLNIKIARAGDADYLQNSCISTSSAGVFCRNLILCRKINSPLVYGESLYQDNVFEAETLMKSDVDLYGLQVNKRLANVAKSYYDAISKFLENN